MGATRSLVWRRAGSVLGKGPGRVVARPWLDIMRGGQRLQCASSQASPRGVRHRRQSGGARGYGQPFALGARYSRVRPS